MSTVVLRADGRLHLQHGPIDCLAQAWGEPAEVKSAYAQAARSFPAILPALCRELPLLRRSQPSPAPHGGVARAMHRAVAPFAALTPMAAVAGAVADAILAALMDGRRLRRAVVNNGGDIAFHLAPGEVLQAGLVSDLAAPALDATVRLTADQAARGLATSGRACKGQGGRSFSFGIADSVTVLAVSAAAADAAATFIANAVDLPGHTAILRRPASDIDPDSDLGNRLVTWHVASLEPGEIDMALDVGRGVADDLRTRGLIAGAVLFLRGRVVGSGTVESRMLTVGAGMLEAT